MWGGQSIIYIYLYLFISTRALTGTEYGYIGKFGDLDTVDQK